MEVTMSQSQLILNPVENLPGLFHVNIDSEVQGLYISDKYKTDDIVKSSKIGFSGRNDYSDMVHDIYNSWAKQLDVDFLSMRLLSGLHAHIVLFMGLGKIGDTVLLLPENAGGHYATKQILERLGYQVIEMVPDNSSYCIDIEKTKEQILNYEPDLIFVDRSEGLYYEDFSELLDNIPDKCGTIFDGSQYLTNILMKDFKSPFSMGFSIMMSTLHKNFPGPQKALVCSKNNNLYWSRIQTAMSSYVSNLHAENILLAGEILKQQDLLKQYSSQMLRNSINLERCLYNQGIPVIRRDVQKKATHHIWLKPETQDKSFEFYKHMEECGLLVNYRKLPYQLGYGIRMGTSAATLQGINDQNISELSSLITKIYQSKTVTPSLIKMTQDFIRTLQPMTITS